MSDITWHEATAETEYQDGMRYLIRLKHRPSHKEETATYRHEHKHNHPFVTSNNNYSRLAITHYALIGMP